MRRYGRNSREEKILIAEMKFDLLFAEDLLQCADKLNALNSAQKS